MRHPLKRVMKKRRRQRRSGFIFICIFFAGNQRYPFFKENGGDYFGEWLASIFLGIIKFRANNGSVDEARYDSEATPEATPDGAGGAAGAIEALIGRDGRSAANQRPSLAAVWILRFPETITYVSIK